MNILLVASAVEIAIATIILWYVVDLLTTMPGEYAYGRQVSDYSGSRPRGNLNVPRATDSRWVSVGACAYHTMNWSGCCSSAVLQADITT